MEYHSVRDRRVVPDNATQERTARRLMVARLRVEIAKREAAQPSDPRKLSHSSAMRRIVVANPLVPHDGGS